MSPLNPVCGAMLSLAFVASLPACVGSHAFPGASQSGAQSGNISDASGGDLIYATGYSASGSRTFMLTYPQGELVGSIDMGAAGLCSDAEGNVYLLSRNAAIEYPHGGTTSIKTLRIPGAEMYSCAVDPSSGDLAVTFSCPPCGYQDLAIFPHGSGTPTRYNAPYAYRCAYDGAGNLFLAGGSGTAISELPAGSSSFTIITLSQDIGDAGQVQWDGKYITLQDIQAPGGIYRIQVSGSAGTVVSETKFKKYMKWENYSWISLSHGTVLLPFSQHGTQTNQLGIWKYPKGGHPTKIIKKFGTGDSGFGAITISAAQSLP
jgi:hypothetical protein